MKNKGLKLGLTSALTIPMICQPLGLLTSCSNKQSEVHLLNFNDFHGAAVGYGDDKYPIDISYKNPGIERMALAMDEIIQEHPNTVILSAGDTNSDEAFSSATHGATMYPLLKELGVRYSAVGNHAFEWGMEDMSARRFDRMARTAETEGNYFLASNILNGNFYTKKTWCYDPTKKAFEEDYSIWKGSRVGWADPYKIINIDGHPICLIGLTTQGAQTDGNHEVVNQLTFMDYIASVHYSKIFAQEELGQDRFNQIEAFILLTHVESDYKKISEEKTLPTGAAADLAETIDTRVDAVISAHSHKEGCGKLFNKNLNRYVWVGQAATAGRAFLDTKLVFDGKRSPDKRLIDVSMEIHHPKIDCGIYDPQSEQGRLAAQQELLEIRSSTSYLPQSNIVRKVSEKFIEERKNLLDMFEMRLGNSKSTGESYAVAIDKTKLGHFYQWPAAVALGKEIEKLTKSENYVVEQLGAWITRAELSGFSSIAESAELTKPSIAFSFLDSVTSEIPKSTDPQDVLTGKMYQILSHDNSAVYGYLTLGQICNIIDYILSGEGTFHYGVSANNLYQHTQTDDPTDKNTYSLYFDPIDQQPCVYDNTFSTYYLAGPMQFWGLKFDVVAQEVKDEKGNIIRRQNLKYVNNKPYIYIYDATDSNNKLDDPDTWNSYDEWVAKAGTNIPKVPILIDNFIYNGGNGQGTFFKPYLQFNGRVNEYTDLTRSLVINFCLSVSGQEEFDLSKSYYNKLVTFN